MMKSIAGRLATQYKRHETWFAVGTLLLLGMLAYLPLMHKFGFYRDDWYMLWTGRAFGPQGIIDLFHQHDLRCGPVSAGRIWACACNSVLPPPPTVKS